MSVRQDILRAARGQMPERVPWTVYDQLLPRGETERILRSQGMGMVFGNLPSGLGYTIEQPNVETCQRLEKVRGRTAVRVHYRTPVGTLTDLRTTSYAKGMAGFHSDWRLEFMVKQPADYEVLEFIIRDQVFCPAYDGVLKAREEMGDDGIIFSCLKRVPFQRLWVEFTGIERLTFDLHDDPEPVQRVMDALLEKDREMWRVVAGSQVDMVQCPDTVTYQVSGPKLFEQYFLPVYEELVQVINPADKPSFIHMDGSGRSLAEVVNKLPEGMIVEAFTPPPMGNYSVAEARAAWNGRPIWINFPSSTFLSQPDEVEAVTLEILRQAVPGDGFLLGVTENFPSKYWQQGMTAIGRVLSRHGGCPIRI